MSQNKNFSLLKTLFFFGVVISLIPIWSGKYFLTSDGPSHLYNAQVLLDLISGNSTEFYSQFYEFNNELEPNWFSHALLIVLLTVFPAFLAEKILLTLFVLGFAFGIRKLLLTINPKAEWLALFGLTLIYHKTFMMGFYNCSFSFVIFFYFLAYWIKNRGNDSYKKWFTLSAYLILLFFTHPMGLMIAVACPFAIMFIDILNKKEGAKHLLKFMLSALPSLLLLILFLLRAKQKTLPLEETTKVLYHKLIEADFLFILNLHERWIAAAISGLFGLTVIITVFSRIRAKQFHLTDAFIPIIVLAVITYFVSPAALAGGGFFIERFQFIIFLMLLLWLASSEITRLLKSVLTIAAFTLGSTLIISRIPSHYKVSQAIEEYVSMAQYIDDESVVLPISFNHKGIEKDSDEFLINHFWLFVHAGEYLGTEKPMVTLTNYEANTSYFPLKYKEAMNPFKIIGSVEKYMPTPNVSHYKEITSQPIDYIVIWCLTEDQKNSESHQTWFATLEMEYDKVAVSEFGRAELYKRVEVLND